MEQRLYQASGNGAQVILVRTGDFIAAESRSSWINNLVQRKYNQYVVYTPGPANVKHSWAYLPDLAKASVELLEQRKGLQSYEEYHFKGHQFSFDELISLIRKQSGKPVKVKAFPWLMIKLLSPFSVLFKGLYEMRYLWQSELNLDDRKLSATLTRTQKTPADVVMQQTGIL